MTAARTDREAIAALRRASRTGVRRQLGLAFDDARRACGLDALAREHPVMLVCGSCACGLVAGAALAARRRPAPAAAGGAPRSAGAARSPWVGLLIQTLVSSLRSWMRPPSAMSGTDPSHQHQQPGAQP